MPSVDEYADLAEASLRHDKDRVRGCIRAAIARARERGQHKAASRLEWVLRDDDRWTAVLDRDPDDLDLRLRTKSIVQRSPRTKVADLVLPEEVRETFDQVVSEWRAADRLAEHGLRPSNRVLLVGPPGNGKTSLAHAFAHELGMPLLVVDYSQLINSYLGESLKNIAEALDQASDYECVLFFDEFETVGNERTGGNDVREIQRITAFLLTSIDEMPGNVLLVAATNHDEALDRAVWRRFQYRMELPAPTEDQLAEYLALYEVRMGFDFGVPVGEMARDATVSSYSDARELGDAAYRRWALAGPGSDPGDVTRAVLASRARTARSMPTAGPSAHERRA